MVLHPTVEALLDAVIDTPLKLHIVQRLHEQPQRVVSAQGLADQLLADLWSVDAALCELATDGVVAVSCDGHAPSFQYAPQPTHAQSIQRLFATYNDPVLRELLHSYLHEMSGYAAYRRAACQQRGATRRHIVTDAPALPPWHERV